MRIDNSRRAWREFVMRRSPVDHFMEPHLPDDPGPVHAVLYEPRQPNPRRYRDPTMKSPAEQTDIQFIEYGEAPEAACGLRVRVVDVKAFDTNEAGVCPRCRELAITRRDDPAKYRRVLELREQRREERRDLDEYHERLDEAD